MNQNWKKTVLVNFDVRMRVADTIVEAEDIGSHVMRTLTTIDADNVSNIEYDVKDISEV